jgi:phosphopantothenate-cysteine ligase
MTLETGSGSDGGDAMMMSPQAGTYEGIRRDVELYQHHIRQGNLFPMSFDTVDKYLCSLQMLCTRLAPLQERVLVYLAAEVSDVYVPTGKMTEHKIQSSGGSSLLLDLDPVPKMLGTLTHEWAPRACVFSFKLETDIALVHKKAVGALKNYGVHGVIANQLQTQQDICYIVSGPRADTLKIERPPAAERIEPLLVGTVVQMHDQFMGPQRCSVIVATDTGAALDQRSAKATHCRLAVTAAPLAMGLLGWWWT